MASSSMFGLLDVCLVIAVESASRYDQINVRTALRLGKAIDAWFQELTSSTEAVRSTN